MCEGGLRMVISPGSAIGKVGPILPGRLNLPVTYLYEVMYYNTPCAYYLERYR
jgi:hypothetical protein